MVTEVVMANWGFYLEEVESALKGEGIGLEQLLKDGLPKGFEPTGYVGLPTNRESPSVGSVDLNEAVHDMVQALRLVRGGQPVVALLSELLACWFKINKDFYREAIEHLAQKHGVEFQEYLETLEKGYA